MKLDKRICAILLITLMPVMVFLIICKFSVSEVSVSIERIDHSIKNDKDVSLAFVYYDKPVISGNSISVEIINAFFDSECHNWFYGSNRINHYQDGLMDKFFNYFSEVREWHGDEVLEQSPLFHKVDSNVMLVNTQYLSICQYTSWQAGGIGQRFFFGSTFDLNTGELLPFDHFVDVDPDTFRNDLASFLYETTLEWDYSLEMAEEYLQIYGANEKHNYELINYGLMLNYEYYYDGESIFLILNNFIGNGGFIVKWNGKTGNEFEAEFVFDAV